MLLKRRSAVVFLGLVVAAWGTPDERDAGRDAGRDSGADAGVDSGRDAGRVDAGTERGGPAGGPNYEEARGAESSTDNVDHDRDPLSIADF